MSTKTTFKRIALVAVAALGLSLVAVAPSNAATLFAAENVTVVTPVSSTTVGVAATTVVKLQAVCKGAESHNNDYSVQNNMGAWEVVLQTVPNDLPSYTAATLTVRATGTDYPYVGAPDMIQAGGSDPAAVALKCSASGTQTGYATASFTPSKAGTYTFKIKGVFQAYADVSWTVTAVDPVQKSATDLTSTTILTATIAGPGTLGIGTAAGSDPPA